MRRLTLVLLVLTALVVAGCTDPDSGDDPDAQPEWVEEVFPEPGATVAVPDAVEVRHTITATDENVRLIIDGVDVTTYASFDAAKLRYESGVGPVILESGDHVAEVQWVRLPAFGAQHEVLDSFTWEFRTG